MSDLKVQHILTLANLLSKGARHNFVTITTASLGKNIKKSQQAASKHLLELERGGFLQRITEGKKVSVKITPKGYAEMVKVSSILKNSLGSIPSVIELKGKIVTGMGEGAYYMSRKGYTKQFKSKIGYIPFPGTLNLQLTKKQFTETKRELENLDGILINGFSDEKRSYGWVKCFHAKINNHIDGELIVLERTHHDDTIVELISKIYLRKKAKLYDGSVVSIKIPLNFD